MAQSSGTAESSADGGAAFELVNPDGRCRLVFNCDHAGHAVPRGCDLGLDDALMQRHIAWDIGAAEVTRRLAALLDAPAILTRYSRLVIDCNRQLDDRTLIPCESDRVTVPGNRAVDEAERARRIACYFRPYHDALAALLDRCTAEGRLPGLIAVHSCTPVMDGVARPWHIGILWNRDGRFAAPLLVRLRAQPDLVVGDNEPYTGRDPAGYSIHVHGAHRGIPHVLLEIRQDLIDTHHGAETWARRLAEPLRSLTEDASRFRVEHR
ncbi:MAG: N-formylglutamate amidohydrolase [Alphaproteobacteria bacterium]|nr:N-formylglutamate amidohydrolase [Alphaproteobacteria bacterium]